MSKLVVLVPDPHGVAALSHLPNVHAVEFTPGSVLPPAAAEAEVLVAHGIEPEAAGGLLAGLPRLRTVQLFSSGMERWLSVVPEGVSVSNADGAHGDTVAEWAVAHLLSHYRDVAGYRRKQQERRWEAHRTGTLSGARVLVFGAGGIGEAIKARLEPFGSHVSMVGRRARDGVHSFAQGRAMVPDHDAVVLSLPLSEETRQMVDVEFLASMKDQAVLVNVGRGGLVDTGALVAECQSGRLHAILDVTDPEPLPRDHPLWTATGVVVTPHAAAITSDVLDRCWSAVARNIEAQSAR